MKIDPNVPAFAGQITRETHQKCECGAYMRGTETMTQDGGIPIRLYIAAMAMQGLLANSAREGTPKDFAYDSLQHADVLIAEYNRTEEKR